MKLVIIFSILFNSGAYSAEKMVYGKDDRQDIGELLDPHIALLADSTAMMVNKEKLTKAPDHQAFYQFETRTLRQQGICPDESFVDQVTLGSCSGFLIAPDRLVTAGHCLKNQKECDQNLWVFGFDSERSFTNKIEADSVYQCQRIISQKVLDKSGLDYAIIQLDRPVSGRSPLRYRKSGRIKKGDSVFIIGNPSGLPTKYSANGVVNYNPKKHFFKATVDSFHGNSGSAVFNSKTLEVEGILVRGYEDYIYTQRGRCGELNTCNTSFCLGEDIVRIKSLNLKN